jgi:hypothetical protein
MSEEKQTKFQGLLLPTGVTSYAQLTNSKSVAKKTRESYKPWVPTEKDKIALEGAVAIPCQGWSPYDAFSLHVSEPTLQGRRGLLNLGQTCFLNVVLQCFAHNPLLRNYFLGDKHNCKQCKVENCTCCEMDKLFSEVSMAPSLHAVDETTDSQS